MKVLALSLIFLVLAGCASQFRDVSSVGEPKQDHEDSKHWMYEAGRR